MLGQYTADFSINFRSHRIGEGFMGHVARDMLRGLHGHVARVPWDMLRGLHGTCFRAPWDLL